MELTRGPSGAGPRLSGTSGVPSELMKPPETGTVRVNDEPPGSNPIMLKKRRQEPGPGGQLIKAGTGTLILTAVNTFTGSTVISGGTLRLDGSLADTVAVLLAYSVLTLTTNLQGNPTALERGHRIFAGSIAILGLIVWVLVRRLQALRRA